MMKVENLKILLVDDHAVVRKGIKATLETVENFNVEILEAESGDEALQYVKSTDFDIILMDITMPEMDGIEATKKIISNNKEQIVIALTMHDETYYVRKIMNAGASGYLLKNTDLDEICLAIKKVLKGEKYYSNQIALKLLDPENQIVSVVKDTLSEREFDVVTLLAKGLTSTEIADRLNISKRTVDSHRYNVFRKFNAKNNAELISIAYQLKVLNT